MHIMIAFATSITERNTSKIYIRKEAKKYNELSATASSRRLWLKKPFYNIGDI